MRRIKRYSRFWIAFYLVLLIGSIVVPIWELVSAFSLAADLGVLPEKWGTYEGNHGPWRRLHWVFREPIPLRGMVWNAITTPILCAVLAGLAWMVRPNRTRLCFALFELGIFFVVLGNFYWLVD